MSKKAVRSAGLAMILVLLALMATVSATKVYEYGFKNNLGSGSVQINLEQLTIDESGSLKKAEPKDVMPGEDVSYMPEVENLRADAYVRVRIDLEMENETSRPVTTADIFKISDGWVQKGDYFYNTKIMKKGEKQVVFQGISVPTCWVQDVEKDLPAVDPGDEPAQATPFTVYAHADAIQSANFTPDFTSDLPWGSVEIEEAKPDDPNTYEAGYGVAKPVVEQNVLRFSKSSGLEANTKDLFRNFQLYMAGNEYKDTLKIKNNASNGITVFFRTKNQNMTDLRGKMTLKIELDGKTLYEGDLFSQKLDSYKELVKLKAGKEANFTYTVKLPEDSKNYYSVLTDDVEWLFKVVEDPSPKTGDDMRLALWFGAFIAAVFAMAFLILWSRNKRDKK